MQGWLVPFGVLLSPILLGRSIGVSNLRAARARLQRGFCPRAVVLFAVVISLLLGRSTSATYKYIALISFFYTFNPTPPTTY